MSWHAKTVEEVIKELNAREIGLNNKEVEERRSIYGPNQLKEKKPISIFQIFANQFKSMVVAVLVVAMLFSLILGEYVDAGVILFVLLINASLGTLQEYRAEKALRALKKLSATTAIVVRGGKQIRIVAEDLVPGDIVILEAGAKVPADLRLTEVYNLQIEEAALTGESVSTNKQVEALQLDIPLGDRKNLAFNHTIVTYGRGKGVVIATGMKTEVGKVAELIQVFQEPLTPLQIKLNDFMKFLARVVFVISILLLLTGLLALNIELKEMFLIVVAQAVSAIPEGLPIVITVALALGVQAMVKRNAIVRHLPAAETLGSTTVICTDKTGTLTRNEMTVKEIFVSNKLYSVTGSGYGVKGDFVYNNQIVSAAEDYHLSLALRIGVLCNDARIDVTNGLETVGDPTEIALVVVAAKGDLIKDRLEHEEPRTDELPFDSERKYMITYHEVDGDKVAYVKGATERVLEICNRIFKDGQILELGETEKRRILETNNEMAAKSLRVIAVGYGRVENDLKQGLIFVGLHGMIDPPRPEAKKAIDLCKDAGIKVMMITGDHKDTAVAIGKELDLIKDEYGVITGVEIDKLNDSELERVIEKVSICARVSTQHKIRIVTALKKKGHVVAMTGDGINDAPALKSADIGVAMGVVGTEVAKESADMILADDNFATIVNAVEEGRGIYLNVQKVVKYLLSTNLGEIFVLAAALLARLPLPLIPVQILWVNLVTDGVSDITLAMEPKERGLMNKKPRNPKENVITKEMVYFILTISAIMCIGTVALFYLELQNGSLERARTIAFTTLAFFQLFNVLNCRSEKESLFSIGIFSNRYIVLALILSILLQLVAIYTPFFGSIMETVPLNLEDWFRIIAISSSVFVGVELKKFVDKRFNRVK